MRRARPMTARAVEGFTSLLRMSGRALIDIKFEPVERAVISLPGGAIILPMSKPQGIPHTTRLLCGECMNLLLGGRGAERHASLESEGQNQILGSGGVAEAYDTYRCRACGAKWRREVLPEEIEGEWRLDPDG